MIDSELLLARIRILHEAATEQSGPWECSLFIEVSRKGEILIPKRFVPTKKVEFDRERVTVNIIGELVPVPQFSDHVKITVLDRFGKLLVEKEGDVSFNGPEDLAQTSYSISGHNLGASKFISWVSSE